MIQRRVAGLRNDPAEEGEKKEEGRMEGSENEKRKIHL